MLIKFSCCFGVARTYQRVPLSLETLGFSSRLRVCKNNYPINLISEQFGTVITKKINNALISVVLERLPPIGENKIDPRKEIEISRQINTMNSQL